MTTLTSTLSALPTHTATPTLEFGRFQLNRWSLDLVDQSALHKAADCPFGPKAARTAYPVRSLRYWWATAALQDIAGQHPHPAFLDAGCQGGYLKRFATPHVKADWTALDFRLDHPHLPTAGYDRIVEADLEKPLPFGNESFHAIVSLHVFEHLRTPEATLREYHRVLHSGGWVLLAFPTMPGWLAPLRERSHRREMEKGDRHAFAHQQVFHPRRCRQMADATGFDVALLSGSHFFRKTGSFLENSRAWVRLNQAWSGLFPSLGSELCVILRKR